MDMDKDEFILERISHGDATALAVFRLCLESRLDKEKTEVIDLWVSDTIGLAYKIKMCLYMLLGVLGIVISFHFNQSILVYIIAVFAIWKIFHYRKSLRLHYLAVSGLSVVKDLTESEMYELLDKIDSVTGALEE